MADLSINSNLINTQNAISKKEITPQKMQNFSPTQTTPPKKDEKHLTDEQKWLLGLGSVAALGIAAYCIIKGRGKQATNQLQKAGENLSSDTNKALPDISKNELPNEKVPTPEVKAGEKAEENSASVIPTPKAAEQSVDCARDLGYLSEIELDAEDKVILDALYADGKPKTFINLVESLVTSKKTNSFEGKVFNATCIYADDLNDLKDVKLIIEELLKKENGADIFSDIEKIRHYNPTIANLILFQNKGVKLNKKSELKLLVDIPLKDSDKVIDITKNNQGATLEMGSVGQRVTDELSGYYQDLFHILKSDNISKSDFENILKIRAKIVERKTDCHDLINELLRKYRPTSEVKTTSDIIKPINDEIHDVVPSTVIKANIDPRWSKSPEEYIVSYSDGASINGHKGYNGSNCRIRCFLKDMYSLANSDGKTIPRYEDLTPELKVKWEYDFEILKRSVEESDKQFAALPPLKKDCIVYRGRKKGVNSSADRVVDFEIIDKAKVGDVIVPDSAYSYCGIHKSLAENWYVGNNPDVERLMYTIRLPKGAKVSVDRQNGGEVLMPRGAKYKLIEKIKEGNNTNVVLEYILPEVSK